MNLVHQNMRYDGSQDWWLSDWYQNWLTLAHANHNG